jgi:HD-like signal output (HDOD) protein
VLGFDVVMNLALGLAVGKSFKLSHHGPLGLDAYWVDAVCSAVLSQQLALYTPFDSREFSGMAYLAGLLHNVGYLVLGYLFPRELSLLNKLILANPDMAVTDMERHVMGVSHEQVGAWLTTAWNLPKELIVAIRWHHSERYQGQHALLAQLMLTVDRLLKRNGRGDAPHGGLPLTVLNALGFSEEQATMVAQSVLARCDDLDALGREFSR